MKAPGTSSRRRAALRAVGALVGLVPLLLGCGPSRAETELLARIASLRAGGELPSGDPRSGARPAGDRPDVQAFFERFHALGARLDEGAFPVDDRAALDDFQRAVTALLDLRACRRARRDGDSLARPGVHTPELRVMREWTNRLCSRARLAADGPGGTAAATTSLATAFELLDRMDDGSLIGLVVRVSQEQELLETIRAITPAVEAGTLLAALEPHLLARRREALEAPVVFETAVFLQAIETVLRADAGLSPEDLEVFGCADVGLIAGAHRLMDRFEGILAAEEPCPSRLGTPEEEATGGARLLYALSEWHEHDVRLERARVALAVEAFHQARGAWPAELGELAGSVLATVPIPPCGDLRYAYASTAEGFHLETVARSASGEGRMRAAGVGTPVPDRR